MSEPRRALLVLVLVACGDDGGPSDPPPTGMPWSDPATWDDGTVPVAGEAVVIPQGKQVLLDVGPPPLAGLTIQGTLLFAEKDLELSADWILVTGKLGIGSDGRLFPNRATITLTADDPNEDVEGLGTRGILVTGTLELHGSPPSPTWTRLAESAAAGATELVLEENVDWRAGDTIVVAPTDFQRIGGTERLMVASAGGASVRLATPLERPRWGVLQYVDPNGVTLTRTTSVTEQVIDERAEVADLSRNILIAGVDDALFRDQGFGAHVIVSDGGVAHVEGVELRRVGQAGRLGRYPFHWHLLSYDVSGTELGDAAGGQYFRRSTVWESTQRCVVLHGTNGVTVAENVCYDVRGHAFFLEDAVERRNVLEDNLALHLVPPAPGQTLLNHELPGFRTGPAGFWLTNPDNVVRRNAVADSAGIGFWLAFPARALGLLQAVPIEPNHTAFGVFEDNVAHSGGVSGVMFDFAPVDEAGNVAETLYFPGNFENEMPFTLSRVTSYKFEFDEDSGADGPYWNRAKNGRYTGFVIADFSGAGFKGASQDCIISENLVVGTTLNAENLPLGGRPSMGAASYHSECDIRDNLFVNIPAVAGQPSGAFATDDYYFRAVDKGLLRNPGNRFIQSHAGFRVTSPNIAGTGNFALAGALWDPNGYWGPAGNFWVYDLPFLTEGAACQPVSEPVHGNDMSCVGPYYGVYRFGLDGSPDSDDNANRGVRYTRNDNGAVWEVPGSTPDGLLGIMRHGAFVKGGSYTVRFPGSTPAGSTLTFAVSNVLEADDGFLLAVEYGGSAPTVFVTSWPNADEIPGSESWDAFQSGNPNWQSLFRGAYWYPVLPAGSLAQVEGSAGDRFWQDTASGLVWFKVRRQGLATIEGDPTSDDVLYSHLIYVLDPSL